MSDESDSPGGEESAAPSYKTRKKAKKNSLVDEQWSLKEITKTKPLIDQPVAKKLKKFWDKNWDKFPENMRTSFISTFKKVNQTESNVKSPSNHIIWKTTVTSCKEDLDWGVWIILRAIYYDPVVHSKDQKDILFKANFMQNQAAKRIQQRYPEVNIFTAKLPGELDSPRPSDWPALGSTSGFPKLKEETPNKKRARSSSYTPTVRGSTELTSGQSDTESARPGSLFSSQASYGEGLQRQLMQVAPPFKKRKTIDKVPTGRGRIRRKIPGSEYIDEEEDDESDFSTSMNRNSTVPGISAHSEKNVGLTEALSVFDEFHYNASPSRHTSEDTLQQLRTKIEALESREIPNENRLVVAVTEQIKGDLGFSSKTDVLKLIANEIEDMMESPEGVHVLEHLKRQGKRNNPHEPPFKSTIRHFLLTWVNAITEAVKNELIGTGSEEDNHPTGDFSRALQKASEVIKGAFRQAHQDLERMAGILNPEDLIKRVDQDMLQDMLKTLLQKLADEDNIPCVVLSEEFYDRLLTEAKERITDDFSAELKMNIQEWISSIARNAVLLDDAEFGVQLGEFVKERVKEYTPQPSVDTDNPAVEIPEKLETSINEHVRKACDAWAKNAGEALRVTASTEQSKIQSDSIENFKCEVNTKTREVLLALSETESQMTKRISSQIEGDRAQWVEAKIQEIILKEFGGQHQLSNPNPAISIDELNIEGKIRAELRKVLDAEVSQICVTQAKQAISEAIVNAQSHGQLAFTQQGAFGSHPVPSTNQMQMVETRVQSLQDKITAFEGVIDCTYQGHSMAKISQPQIQHMQHAMDGYAERLGEIEEFHQQVKALQRKCDRLVAIICQLTLLLVAVGVGIVISRYMIIGDSYQLRLPYYHYRHV
ncbi:Ff.00g073920.m01.CDS01 [Fusarium sp. VM40]|nr:Ff.00g073920.m01.CDS01 [Fusarium sp. VM40]